MKTKGPTYSLSKLDSLCRNWSRRRGTSWMQVNLISVGDEGKPSHDGDVKSYGWQMLHHRGNVASNEWPNDVASR